MADKNDTDGIDRRKEQRFRIELPIRYYFIHNIEKATTKNYRQGKTCDVSSYGVLFQAKVIDPSILEEALVGDILMEVTIKAPEIGDFKATGRVVRVTPLEDSVENSYLIGVEYTDADEEKRLALYDYASESGQPA